jgi:hypothetical protein
VQAKPGTQIDGGAGRVRGQTDGVEFRFCTRSRGIDVTDHPGINRAKKPFVVITDRACHRGDLMKQMALAARIRYGRPGGALAL